MRSRMTLWTLGRLSVFLLLTSALGCSALTPIKGVPVGAYPDDMRGGLRSGKETIDLSLLGQTPSAQYLLDAGDVLGVYIEGVLGKREEVPPVYFPQNSETPPSLGYPIPIREDGTISLPLAGTLTVRGMSVRQVEDRIRQAYTVDQQILQPGRDRILISLQRPRTYNVLVVRQEAGAGELGMTSGNVGSVTLGVTKRGTGKMVALQAYKNDVLHALTETGGLPGLDAENTIYVIRRRGSMPGGMQPACQVPPVFQPSPHSLPPVGTQPELRQGPPTPVLPAPVGPASFYAPRGSSRGLIQRMSGEMPARPAPIATGRYAPPRWQTANANRGSSFGRPRTAAFQPAVLSGQGETQPAQYGPAPEFDGGQQGPMEPQGPIGPQGPEYGPPQGPMQNDMGPGFAPQAPALTVGPSTQWQGGPQFDPAMPQPSPQDFANMNVLERFGRNAQIVRIPVRLHPGEPLNITEQDIILHDGDIVFIESRETEIFYTGGLLGGGQYVLPRDYDLDVLGAVSIASGRQASSSGTGFGNHIGGISALNQDISVSASDVIVLRKIPGGGQVPIRIDLNKAVRDPSQRVRIQPGDYVILQYKCHEAVAAFIERNLLAGGIIGLAAVGGTGGAAR